MLNSPLNAITVGTNYDSLSLGNRCGERTPRLWITWVCVRRVIRLCLMKKTYETRQKLYFSQLTSVALPDSMLSISRITNSHMRQVEDTLTGLTTFTGALTAFTGASGVARRVKTVK